MTMFKYYCNRENTISLIISGPGKINAAAAAAMTMNQPICKNTDAWLNIGIAGHKSYPVGTAYLVNKITDYASGEVWYPQFVFKPPVTTASLVTLDVPGNNYSEELFDMETAGYFQIASRYGTNELIHSIKIISDNEISSTENINARVTRELIHHNLDTIESIVNILDKISRQLQQRYQSPADFDAIIKRWHFSVYQQHILFRQLQRWDILRPGDSVLNHCKNIKNSKELLEYLTLDINQSFMKYQIHVPDNIH